MRIEPDSGVRVRNGRYEAAVPSMDGRDRTAQVQSLNAILAKAGRYAVMPSWGAAPPIFELQLVTNALSWGARAPLMLGVWNDVFLDVRGRAQLVRIASALQKHPLVSCVAYVAPARVAGGVRESAAGAGERRDAPKPLMWPTPERLAADTSCDRPLSAGPRAPMGGRPPRPPRPR